MNILIVGAGAVGKVYGRHLALGGAKVSFYVKDKYAEAVKRGLTFYVLNDKKTRHTPLIWKDYGVFTTPNSASKEKWDYVILAMSSTALRSGWIDEFLPAIKDASVLTLQPGMFDFEYLSARMPKTRLIDGTINVVSYEAPLPKEIVPVPGTAYWFPPGSHAAFSGEPSRTTPLIETFTKGNFAAKSSTDARKQNVAAGPSLTLLTRALELSDWSFEKLKNGNWLKIACEAMPEAVAVQAKKTGSPMPKTFLLKPWFFKLILNLTKFVIPFDFETYMKVHFTKVQDQVHDNLRTMFEYGRTHSIPTGNLEKLKP